MKKHFLALLLLSAASIARGAGFAGVAPWKYPSPPTDGQTWVYVAADGAWEPGAGASGTVASVGLSAPSIFTVSGSPVTTTGTLGFTYNGILGDTIYGSAANTLAALAGNTSATMAVLTQTGNGAASAAPVWTSTSGTGNIARVTSPTFVTPTLGVATATSVNGLTISTSTGTLTIANGSTLATSGAFSGTLTLTATTNSTLPAGTHSLAPLDSPAFTTPNIGVASGTSLTLSGLTSGRVPFSTTAGLLTDAAAFTFNSGTGSLSATNFVGGGASVTGVNAATLGGATFAAPGAIGGTTPSTGAFTTLSTTGVATLNAAPAVVIAGAGTFTTGMTVLQPSMPTGSSGIISITVGAANSSKNSGYIDFVNQGGAGSASNYVGLGIAGFATGVNVFSTGDVVIGGGVTDTTGNGVLQVEDPSSGTFHNSASILQANAPTGSTGAGGFVYGVTTGTKNSGYFAFFYAGGGGSSSNYSGWGLSGVAPNINIFGSGNTVVNSTTDDGAHVFQVAGATGMATVTAGGTLSIKSGTNAAAGTVTLVAGSGTITSTAIDVNTAITLTMKTSGGTPSVYEPNKLVSAGSAAITGLATDTSTYNWVALKVN